MSTPFDYPQRNPYGSTYPINGSPYAATPMSPVPVTSPMAGRVRRECGNCSFAVELSTYDSPDRLGEAGSKIDELLAAHAKRAHSSSTLGRWVTE